MINRDNYQDVKAHLDYRRRIIQNDAQTIRNAWISLKHLLQWADELSLSEAPKFKVSFPEYLLSARNDERKGTPLAPSTMHKILRFARAFFEWARRAEVSKYKGISEGWLDTLRVRRSKGMHTKLNTRQIWTLEEVRKVLQVTPPDNSLRWKRDKAAIAFMFLSGIRVGAFCTLPLEAVDVERKRIKQLPELGVHTKNHKAAITTFLNLSDLLQVVREWDDLARSRAESGRVAWYTRLDKTGMTIDGHDLITPDRKPGGKISPLSTGMKELCKLAGITYKSPHKLRHGFGTWGVKHTKNMAELKAISQNLMHANVGITDGTYGRLPEDDAFDIISGLGDE